MTDKPTPQKATDSTARQIDTIARVVADLHIAYRNLSIYPPTHEQAKQSVQKAYAGLSKAFEDRESFTLAFRGSWSLQSVAILPLSSGMQHTGTCRHWMGGVPCYRLVLGRG